MASSSARRLRAWGSWLVVEGDESDHSIGSLAPQIAVVTNIEPITTRHTFQECLRAFFDEVMTVPEVIYSTGLPPVALKLAVPGDHNRQNAAAAWPLELASVPRADAEEATRFTGRAGSARR